MTKQMAGNAQGSEYSGVRELAVTCLSKVLNDRVALDVLLDQEMATRPLSQTERDWLREVTAGVLRWKGRLDQAIDSAVSRERPTGRVRRFLLIAAYQLIAQDRVPPAWVVSETVDAIKAKEGEKAARFANAVLRRISDTRESWKSLEFPGEEASASEQAAWASMPDWMWYRLRRQHGMAAARKFAELSLTRPVFWLREKASEQPRLWDLDHPLVEEESLTKGQAIVQDLSSQTVIQEVRAQLVKHGLFSGLGVDLCAAPGGKAVGLTWSGARVLASDVHPERLLKMKQNLVNTAPEVQVLSKEEVRSQANSSSEIAWVWVDAPCTSSGIIRKHPDIKWVREEKELQRLAPEQNQLLEEGLSLLKAPKGALVYSVCSIFKEEGQQRVADFLKKHPELKIEQEWVRLPGESLEGDGFYAVFLLKNE